MQRLAFHHQNGVIVAWCPQDIHNQNISRYNVDPFQLHQVPNLLLKHCLSSSQMFQIVIRIWPSRICWQKIEREQKKKREVSDGSWDRGLAYNFICTFLWEKKLHWAKDHGLSYTTMELRQVMNQLEGLDSMSHYQNKCTKKAIPPLEPA